MWSMHTNKIKREFCNTEIGPVMTREQHMQKMSLAKIRMSRWMFRKIRKDKNRNECIQEHFMIVSIGDKLQETCMRWFGYIRYRPTMTLVLKSFLTQVDGHSRVGRRGHGRK